jgi:hypothetical protein
MKEAVKTNSFFVVVETNQHQKMFNPSPNQRKIIFKKISIKIQY